MPTQKIICPNCKTEISIDDVLTHQIEETIRKDFAAEQEKKDQEIKKREQALQENKRQLETASQQLQETINKKVAENISLEKNKLKLSIKADLEKESAEELKFLSEQLAEKDKKLDEARKLELEMRRQKQQLEEAKKSFEIEKERQLDFERKKISEEASKKAAEENQFKLLEFSKKLEDAQKANAELTRKLQQGSQQTQGEVLELELEQMLRREFPYDEITPVGKGIYGADIVQKVRDKHGRECGSIIWEMKNTKSWTEGWIQKLKEDQRNIKADVAVIVTTVLPKDEKTFCWRDGVWVSNFTTVAGLVFALRSNLIQLNSLKLASVGKNDKMEVLYNYLTGTEFKQKIEAIVESFSMMKTDLDREKMVYQKSWEKREKLISRVLNNTVGMYGELEGMMGKALPKIDMLELDEGESDLDTEASVTATTTTTTTTLKIEEVTLF